MALVSWNAGSNDWNYAGGRSGACGSVYLFISNWIGDNDRLGSFYAVFKMEDSESVFFVVRIPRFSLLTHALGCTENNFVLYDILGTEFVKNQEIDAAIFCYEKAIEITPSFSQAQYNAGNAYARKNMIDEAIKHYKIAIHYDPNHNPSHHNLAILLKNRSDCIEISSKTLFKSNKSQ